jgi:aspartate kinase
MRVLKFGGTSVADAEAIGRLVQIVGTRRGCRTVIVSALGGVTDRLLAIDALAGSDLAAAKAALAAVLARHLAVADALADPTARRMIDAMLRGIGVGAERTVDAIAAAGGSSPALTDKLLAAGELWSSRLVSAFLTCSGAHAQWIDARHVVRTDGTHGHAVPDFDATERAVSRLVRPALALDRVVVLGGFVGSGPDGATTTLGRGGSDYSAALVGACLMADEIEIWTDVDGVFSADPRVVKRARVLSTLSYEDAEILATFGAKVLHPKTIEPAAALDIPVRVLNSRRPDEPGTRIDGAGSRETGYAAVASRTGVCLVCLTAQSRRPDGSFAARALQALADAQIAVLVGEVHKGRLTVAVDHGANLDALRSRVSDFADVQWRNGLSAVCAVGDRLANDPRLVARAFAMLDGREVHLVARPGGASALAVVIEDRDAHDLVARLHDAFAGDAAVAREAVAS